jgi:hypothetical protein
LEQVKVRIYLDKVNDGCILEAIGTEGEHFSSQSGITNI